MHHPTDRMTHTTAFVTPVVEHWLEREIAQWVHHEGSIRRPIAPSANALTMELQLDPLDTDITIRKNALHVIKHIIMSSIYSCSIILKLLTPMKYKIFPSVYTQH